MLSFSFSSSLNLYALCSECLFAALLRKLYLISQRPSESPHPAVSSIMVRFQTVIGTVLGLAASVYAVPQQTTSSVSTSPASATATATVTATTTDAPTARQACALAASKQADYFSAYPDRKLDTARHLCVYLLLTTRRKKGPDSSPDCV